MRLKCIKLAGFKSFVDPTTVHFPSNLCAVVGPNGCGKSNIIDAVRWVMGESSAKNLRGEAMTDVIFNGSNSRKPIGQASIELVFDNNDGKIAGEYASYSEISVKRKVTRDGQNLYYLNGNKCRRRDITDIFLGTGLGPRSYAIIEQGMISRLIEARPEDLRIYVEEAAGISRYKERRRDTENRMRRTQENLERLTDIRDELERQISRLERQAQAAEKYKKYKASERELKATLQAVKFRDLQVQADLKQQGITALELEVEAAVTTQVHHDTNIEKQRVRHAELGDRFNEVQGRFYSVGADIARLEQTIQHIQEREKQLQRDLEQTVRDCAQAQEHLDADLHKSEGWTAESLEIEPEVELLQETEAQSAEALVLAEEAMQQWQQEWDRFNQKAAQPKQQAEVQQSRIQYLEQIQQRLLDRLRKLESESQGLVIGDSESEIGILQEQLAEVEIQLEMASARAEQAATRASEHRIREQQCQSELSRLRESSQQAKGRRASLEALQQTALGQTESGVNDWLARNGLQNAGRVAEMLQVETGWEKAVETVLGTFLQGVCVESLDAYAASLIDVDQGDMILLDTGVGNAAGGAESILTRIRGDGNRLGFLENVLTADTLERALELRGRLTSWQSVVTPDGIWLGPNWIRVAREKDTGSGVLARQKELDTLSLQIAGYDQEIAGLEELLEQSKQAHIDAERERDDARAQTDQLMRQQNGIRNQLTTLTARVEQVLEGRRRAASEIAEVREQMAAEAENLAEARGILQEAIDIMEQDTGERERLLTWRDELRTRLDTVRQKARRDKDRAHELALRYQSVKTQLQAIQQGIQRLQEQMQRLLERREGLQEQLQNSVDPIDDHRAELEGLLNRRVAVEDELNEARRALEDVETALRQTEKQRHQLEHRFAGDRQQQAGMAVAGGGAPGTEQHGEQRHRHRHPQRTVTHRRDITAALHQQIETGAHRLQLQGDIGHGADQHHAGNHRRKRRAAAQASSHEVGQRSAVALVRQAHQPPQQRPAEGEQRNHADEGRRQPPARTLRLRHRAEERPRRAVHTQRQRVHPHPRQPRMPRPRLAEQRRREQQPQPDQRRQ